MDIGSIANVGDPEEEADWSRSQDDWTEEKWSEEGSEEFLNVVKGTGKYPKGGCFACQGDHYQSTCPKLGKAGKGGKEKTEPQERGKGTAKAHFKKRTRGRDTCQVRLSIVTDRDWPGVARKAKGQAGARERGGLGTKPGRSTNRMVCGMVWESSHH